MQAVSPLPHFILVTPLYGGPKLMSEPASPGPNSILSNCYTTPRYPKPLLVLIYKSDFFPIHSLNTVFIKCYYLCVIYLRLLSKEHPPLFVSISIVAFLRSLLITIESASFESVMLKSFTWIAGEREGSTALAFFFFFCFSQGSILFTAVVSSRQSSKWSSL